MLLGWGREMASQWWQQSYTSVAEEAGDEASSRADGKSSGRVIVGAEKRRERNVHSQGEMCCDEKQKWEYSESRQVSGSSEGERRRRKRKLCKHRQMRASSSESYFSVSESAKEDPAWQEQKHWLGKWAAVTLAPTGVADWKCEFLSAQRKNPQTQRRWLLGLLSLLLIFESTLDFLLVNIWWF